MTVEQLSLILSAIAAIASVISVFLGISNRRRQKRHLKNRYDVLDEHYCSPYSHLMDLSGRDNANLEMKTLEKDLGINR